MHGDAESPFFRLKLAVFDTLPYVGVLISSLTKSFSGASNVTSSLAFLSQLTGHSLVLNPASWYHNTLRNLLTDN